MQMAVTNILFAASEAYPLVKTGGLGDVAGSLCRALRNLNKDLRLVLPAYPMAMEVVRHKKRLVSFVQDEESVTIWQALLPGTRVTVLLVACDKYFDREGNPYQDDQGEDWPDNAERFGLFCRVIEGIAIDHYGLGWRADVVHCNDWQTGLVPMLLAEQRQRPATVFTIHNLGYQGLFPFTAFQNLKLPAIYWHHERLEYHKQLSFIKGGLVYADRINTVSPTYAQEIQTPKFGCGLEGLLMHRQSRLSGILNGIDTDVWNPGTDKLISHRYNSKTLNRKLNNKLDLQRQLRLPEDPEIPLLGKVGRLVKQKGVDLVIKALPELLKQPMQLVVLGTGDTRFADSLRKLAKQWPEKLAVYIGYSEALAHRIEAGADMFLMPSRYEPCGLNQMYSQRYGTLPIVSAVGGLADTVTDPSMIKDKNEIADGFVIANYSVKGIIEAVNRAIERYHDKPSWRQMQRAAMHKDMTWKDRAHEYLALYEQALKDSRSSADYE
ncbi:MAG: glycogen synthase GlgA [Gammaproteobacteria bacterium]|nr:MAG: glycogen synthase GlgA [Gammaproteobacteria bacterium]